jgi:hypothetical protein
VFLVGIIPTAYLFLLFALILALSARRMLARRGDPAGTATTADTWGWAGGFGWTRATPTAARGWRTGCSACRSGCC